VLPPTPTSGLQYLERHERGIHKIPQFMDEEPHPFLVPVRGFVGV
jgi:hypothetical protein